MRECLRRWNRRYLRYSEVIDGLRMTAGAKETDATAECGVDLPDALLFARPAEREVFRAVRDLRAERGPAAEIWPGDVQAYLDAKFPASRPHSIDTINHALRALKARELAWSHPERGWQLGSEQPRLPRCNGQSDRPSAPELRSYRERMADEGVRRFTRGEAMSRPKIWVPGEKSEYGVIVTDARTEREVAERTGEMRVPTRGRLSTVAAARGELVRTEGKYVIVKFPGDEQLAVRALGDWQLNGLTEPEPEASEVSVVGSGAA